MKVGRELGFYIASGERTEHSLTRRNWQRFHCGDPSRNRPEPQIGVEAFAKVTEYLVSKSKEYSK
jgi:hypothetical protein